MELKQILSNILTFVMEHSLLFAAISAFLFFVLMFFVVSQVGSELFSIYRRNFYTRVDKGLRDVVVIMEPGQVFTLTLTAAVILGPLVWFLTNFFMATIVVGVILFAPPIMLQVMKRRRIEKFVAQLPDALSAMASSMRSGLNLVKAMQQIVKNQPDPLAQEFAQMLVEYRVGQDLNQSLDDLAQRISRQEVVLMNSAIKISRAVGGNLADTLDILAKTLREKSKVEGKIRALTSMGKAQGRLAAGFPVFMGFVFYKLEPQAMSLLFTSQLGQIWIVAMVIMAILGAVFIKKVVTVDV